MGTKNPKLILDKQDFLLIEKKPNRTLWRCCQYYYAKESRCKAKLVTSGRVVTVDGAHNHDIAPKTKYKYESLLSQKVTIIRGNKQ